MPPHNGGKLAGIAQILHIHVTDAGNKRRVTHEKQGVMAKPPGRTLPWTVHRPDRRK
jgi:hypothetical protein